MQIEAKSFISLAEAAGKVAVFDSEVSNLRGDYGGFLSFTIKPLGCKPITYSCNPGDDRKLVREVRDHMEQYALWVGFYSKMFDIPYLQTRLLRHNQRALDKRHHLDVYFLLKSRTLTSRRSQAHFCDFLDTSEQKMSVSPNVWAEVSRNPQKHLKTLKARSESDCAGLECLYQKTKHLIVDISR